VNSRLAGRRRIVARLIIAAAANNPASSHSDPTRHRKHGGILSGERGGVALTWAVLLTVSVAVAGEAPVRFKEVGETVQVKLV
jgi:hypothetical protein